MASNNYGDRYISDVWTNNTPSINAFETDELVFDNENIKVPKIAHSNNMCLSGPSAILPIYKMSLFDIEHNTSSIYNRYFISNEPMVYEDCPVRVRRFGLRDTSKMGAILFGLDGLVVVTNFNFIGAYPSEIGSLTVYNSTDSGQTIPIPSVSPDDSPVGVVFDVLPDQKIYEGVAIAGLPATLSIQPHENITVNLSPNEPENNTNLTAGIFHTSIGACVIPRGLYADDISTNGNNLTIYNTTDIITTILFRDEATDEENVNFLGYIHQLTNVDVIDPVGEVSVDLENDALDSIHFVQVHETVTINPGASENVIFKNIVITTTDTLQPMMLHNAETGQNDISDGSVELRRYAKPISMVSGLKVITPVINEVDEANKTISVRLLNISASAMILEQNTTALGIVVAQAAQLTGRNTDGSIYTT
uniref:Uncharacterized protein n=1 Tax=Chionoecetes opilio bacilliform virus TaxID=1825681 RepID=A0A1Q3DL44_9VIRU|nr:wsv526-like protein [Chionoecetes opilio bacilliform virus]GAV93182.1 hypothetical protein SCV_059 [Chionoecetes opilio bacilliform virus]